MKKYLLTLLLFIPFLVKSQSCEVSGNQNGIWDCDTVFVVDNVIVPEDSRLIIAEGTKVIFKDYFSIIVNGSFEAIGCENDSIYFTVTDTTGFYRWDCGDGGWNGLVFQNVKDTLRLEYCHFSYGKAAENMTRGGAVRIYNTDYAVIDNCTFYCNHTREKGGALYAEHSDILITNCEVDANIAFTNDGSYTHGAGFQFHRCSVKMEDMYFHDNTCNTCYGGGVNFDSCYVDVNKAVFEDNFAVNAAGMGIQRSNDYEVRISNALFNNNIVKHYGGAMAMATTSPLIQNVTMANNYCVGAGGGAMQFYSEARPVFKNCIIWGNDWLGGSGAITDGSQIFVWGSDCAPEFYNTLIEGGFKQIHGNQYVAVYDFPTMLEVDPLFIDTVARNFQLQTDSPAINSGTIDTTGLMMPATDLLGNPRIVGSRVDMGCYESSVTYVNKIKSQDNNLKIFPNPLTSNSVCSFENKTASQVTLKVTDIRGAQLFVKDLGILPAGTNEISLSELTNVLKNNNIYFINIETQGKTLKAKIVY